MTHHPETVMTGAGWAFLVTGWTAIIALAVFCVSRLLRKQHVSESDDETE